MNKYIGISLIFLFLVTFFLCIEGPKLPIPSLGNSNKFHKYLELTPQDTTILLGDSFRYSVSYRTDEPDAKLRLTCAEEGVVSIDESSRVVTAISEGIAHIKGELGSLQVDLVVRVKNVKK